MAATTKYDAILMDCRMPRMDGFTATGEIRRREAATRAHTPIIAMTASALVADRERCLAAGMDDYLTKPVDPAELETALARWTTGKGLIDPDDTPPELPTRRSGTDTIGERLNELAGDRTVPEKTLVDRLVASFRTRAPRHLTAITDAYEAGDAARLEDEAHILRGAAGNIGATTIMTICETIENQARTGTLNDGLADELHQLRTELDRAEHRLSTFQTT